MAIDARKSDIGGYAAASEPVTLKPRCFSSPARDAIAVPQIPTRCTCCWSTASRLPDSRRGLQYLQRHAGLIRQEFCLDAERQSKVAARDMPGLHSVDDRDLVLSEHPRDHLLQLVVLLAGLNAFEHLTEDEPTHVLEFSGEPQVHQHAVDLVRLFRDVFDEQ